MQVETLIDVSHRAAKACTLAPLADTSKAGTIMLLMARRKLERKATTVYFALTIAGSLSHFVIASFLPAQQLHSKR